MKPVLIISLFISASLTSHSQSIRFSSLSFRDALAKAKKENKPIFIEVYTTWCTYCKQMERDVFTTKEAGDYYNGHFINLRYDVLKTGGIQIRKTYTLPGLPAFLYLTPDGLVALKTAGLQPVTTFVANGDSAITIQKKSPNSNKTIRA